MNNNAITPSVEAGRFLSKEKVHLIKQLYCKQASDTELQHFLEVCESRRLDPVLKQIYAVFRFSRKENRAIMTIQVGIDGQRSLASRTGEYAGNDAAKFEWQENGLPSSATVTVYRMVANQKCAFTGIAHWDEYFPKDEKLQNFWKLMPKGQLAKCAEALALRKAFPGELSGLYEPSEMDQIGPEKILQVREVPKPAPKLVPQEVKEITGFAQPEVDPFFPKTDLEQKYELSEYVVPAGSFKGKKLKDISHLEWRKYVREVDEKLKDPQFPEGMRKDAHQLLGVIEDYLAKTPNA